MASPSFLAFDLGATSGRAILGTLSDGKLTTRELLRFPNRMLQLNGHYHWNIFGLYESLKEGLRVCALEKCDLRSIGIDTWGVDFAFIGSDGSVMGLPFAYRDPYTDGMPEAFFGLVPRNELYAMTGIQIMNFNSLFQLYAQSRIKSSQLHAAAKVLFMPDALTYMLTGKQVTEYTIASTSQILNPVTRTMEPALLRAASLSPDLFNPLVMPGTVVGPLTDVLALESGLGNVPVVAVAGHDTASAVAAVPAENENFAYLSSGTWSLMGIESREPIINETSSALNFTNEGGIDGTTRFLKNITGMWLLEQCRVVWEKEGKECSYALLAQMAEGAKPFGSLVDPDHASFANPANMVEAIAGYCSQSGQPIPASMGEVTRCIFESLALKYSSVLDKLKSVASFRIDKLHIIGGGSQNGLLNQYTANAIGIPVAAGPSEATALGNILVQAKAMGLVNSLWDLRKIVRDSVEMKHYVPSDSAAWEAQKARFAGLPA